MPSLPLVFLGPAITVILTLKGEHSSKTSSSHVSLPQRNHLPLALSFPPAPPPPSLPGTSMCTSVPLPVKWLLFWKRAERIPAPVQSTYWKCLTESQQLLGYLRLREWWVIEVSHFKDAKSQLLVHPMERSNLQALSEEFIIAFFFFFPPYLFIYLRLMVSLKNPFVSIRGVRAERAAPCILHGK